MFKTLGTVAAFALITSATWFGLGVGSTTNAWLASNHTKAYCNDEDRISFGWTFTNVEPNEDKYTMDVVITETITGQSVTETNVAPGDTISGTFDTDFTSVSSWRVKFDMTWSDGRVGTHQMGADHLGLECQQPEEPKQIEVCRDGEVITINEEDRRDTDTEAPCPTPEEETVEVCRDDEVITVKKSEVRDSDLEGECPGEVAGEQTPVLPNTGASALVSVGLGLATLGSAGYGAIRSRK